MNIGDRKNVQQNRQLTSIVRKAPAQPKAETQATSGPTESFQTSEAKPTVMQRMGSTLQTLNPLPLLKSAGNAALYVATDLIPGTIGAGVSAVKDVMTGGARESHFEHKVDAGSEEAAGKRFAEAKDRLLNPNEWKKLGPGFGAASFQVHGQDGKPVEGAPKKGDYLKIGLPDPFPYVWVQIDKIEVGDKEAEVVVRPSADPTAKNQNPNNPSVIHFFGDETTNVFKVRQEGNEVISSVSGKNEKLNTKAGFMGKVIASGRLIGAWMGAKKPQWNAFTRKMVEGPTQTKALQSSGMETALRVSSDAMNSGKETK